MSQKNEEGFTEKKEREKKRIEEGVERLEKRKKMIGRKYSKAGSKEEAVERGERE